MKDLQNLENGRLRERKTHFLLHFIIFIVQPVFFLVILKNPKRLDQ